jgi:hypothetical protein
MILTIKKISDSKLIVGGAAILAALNKNIAIEKIGNANSKPLLI